MSPAHKELVFDFADMRLISLQCSECLTEVTIDASSNKGRRNQGVPVECPSCGTKFDHVSVQAPIASYLDLYTTLVKIKHKVRLKVIVEKEKAETR
ncbi:MAG: hypothetical protein DMG16_23365 [Acidobacteria bacterium]|nr:MAG: hypothetical protein DMG16_23365 [Acidobacteriota bacterium]